MSGRLRGLLAALILLPTFPASAEDEWVDLSEETGQGLYVEKCGMCHRPGGMGHGILSRRLPPEQASLEDRQDLETAFVSTVVRNGFGVMFPLSRAEVSDRQVAAIAEYLSRE